MHGDSREEAEAQLQISENSHLEQWNVFMSNSLNRKLYYKTCDIVKKFRRQQSKFKFLQECLQYGVAPPTLRAKFTPPSHVK